MLEARFELHVLGGASASGSASDTQIQRFLKEIAVTRGDKEIARHRAEVFVTAGEYSESTNEFMKALYLTLGRYVPEQYTGPTVLYMT
jgi:hypothetical protein